MEEILTSVNKTALMTESLQKLESKIDPIMTSSMGVVKNSNVIL